MLVEITAPGVRKLLEELWAVEDENAALILESVCHKLATEPNPWEYDPACDCVRCADETAFRAAEQKANKQWYDPLAYFVDVEANISNKPFGV